MTPEQAAELIAGHKDDIDLHRSEMTAAAQRLRAIARECVRSGYSRKELADACGVQPSAITRWLGPARRYVRRPSW